MVAPASLRKGGALEFRLVAFRQEGFEGAIEVPPADLGGGLSTAGTLLPKGQSSAPLVVRASEDADASSRVIELAGREVRQDAEGTGLMRAVRPAMTVRGTTKVQNRDVPAAVRLAREFVVGVAEETAPIEVRQELARQSVPQGGAFEVPLRLVRRAGAEGPVTVAVQGLNKTANIEAPDVAFGAGETEKTLKVTVRADAPVQTHVIHWAARTKVQYLRNAREREEARLALEAVTGRLKAAKDDATAGGQSAQQLEEERVLAEKRLQELDKAVKDVEVSAVTSPLVVDVQAVAAPAASSK